MRFVFNETALGAILISDLALSSDEMIVLPPIAAFEADLTETCTGEIHFSDQSTFSPTEWFWEFGDGATSTEEDPTHTYTENGVYTVTLTVTNPAGTDNTTEAAYILVNRPTAPVATGTTICGPGEATVSVTGGAGDYYWYDAATDGTLLGTGANLTADINEKTNPFQTD